MEQPKGPSLREVLNYRPEEHLNASEVEWIRRTFGESNIGINILRKMFIPTVSDPSMPIEEFGNDAFAARIDFASMLPEHASRLAIARQDAFKFIMGALVKLKVIAASKDEDPMTAAMRRSKDSTV